MMHRSLRCGERWTLNIEYAYTAAIHTELLTACLRRGLSRMAMRHPGRSVAEGILQERTPLRILGETVSAVTSKTTPSEMNGVQRLSIDTYVAIHRSVRGFYGMNFIYM